VVADGRALRGDLDTILLMALRREPGRRYASVDRLGEDVRRYLEERPVLARIESRVYRTMNFVRRQRAAVGLAAVIALALATVAVLTERHTQSLRRESERTAAQRDQASAVTHTLWSLLGQLTDSLGRPLSVADVLDHAEPTIIRQYARQPNVRATMQSALGQIYLNHGDLSRAARLLREAVASQREYGRDSADLATKLESLGRLLARVQEYAGAESAGYEARNIRAQLSPGAVDQEAEATLGAALMGEEKYADAERIFRDLVSVREQRPNAPPGTPAEILLGESLRRQGRNEEASAVFRQELARLESAPEPDSERIASAQSYLAAAQAMMGQGWTADSLLLRAYAMMAATQPLQFQRIGRGTVMANRSELAARRGDDGAAAALADSARALWQGVLPPADARWSTLGRVEALLLRDRRQPAAAVVRLTALLDTLRSMPHPNYYMYRRTEATLADVFDRWGQPDSAAMHRALARPGAALTHTRKR